MTRYRAIIACAEDEEEEVQATFDTEAERTAYLQGIDDACSHGWSDYTLVATDTIEEDQHENP